MVIGLTTLYTGTGTGIGYRSFAVEILPLVRPSPSAAAAGRTNPMLIAILLPLSVLHSVTLSRTAVHVGLSDVERAVEAAAADKASVVVLELTTKEDCAAVDDASFESALGFDEYRSHVVRTSELRLAIQQSPAPVIAIADGAITGAAAGIFSAASYRVATERFAYTQPACRAGLCPGHGAIDALSTLPQGHIAMAVALGALELNAHDACELGLATQYAPSSALSELAVELACSPPEYYDVPLSRRTSRAPPLHLVPLFAAEAAAPLNAALLRAFGSTEAQLPVRAVLTRERDIAVEHAAALAEEPCGIHIRTQERAQTVADVLAAACAAFERGCTSANPEALTTTRVAMELARRRRSSARSAAAATASTTAASSIATEDAAATPSEPPQKDARRTSRAAHELSLALDFALDARLRAVAIPEGMPGALAAERDSIVAEIRSSASESEGVASARRRLF